MLTSWRAGEFELFHIYLSLTLDEKYRLIKIAEGFVVGEQAHLYGESIDVMRLARLMKQDVISQNGGNCDNRNPTSTSHTSAGG